MAKVTTNFISEDNIEQATIVLLQNTFAYQHINAFTHNPNDLNDQTGRTDKRDVVLQQRLQAKCQQLNQIGRASCRERV